ncbi:hypothetical protein B0T18DRAFT_356562 [Schizothecium vesticola]|uniref:DUF7708 domain-containing protein n=1 Tax=Schizothecium vesticola TaxID=314040 RepID=A0AA40KBH1_9PEZI|nr:hypothetical protein B0T18DRAFT_356562 [Schizothecium vesticola]
MSFSLRPNKTLFIRPKWSSSSSDPTPAATAPQGTSPGGQLALSRTNSDQISPLQKTGRTSSAPWITTATTPWAPAPWNPDDLAVRRFSKPAIATHTHALTEHIGSARRAYTKAFTAIHKSVAAKNINVSAVLASSTGEDVAEAALGLYDADASVDKSGASRFVDTLQHYHGVFDVLCQTDFSFLTLIWGGMKLILIMAKNRGDLLVKITDMLVDVGMALSRVEMLVKLYPTTRMVELTAKLYAAFLEFLEEVIALFQRSAVRQLFSSLVQPFEDKFGRVMDRIQRVEGWIQKDAMVLHAMQSASMAHHQLDSLLQRRHMEATLRGTPEGFVPDLLLKIKDTLFQGFESQADHHESLAATYGVTSSAWKPWFAEEQRHLPSNLAPKARLTHGLCDAPDFQHALQWKDQQKAQSPHVPSAYIIWTPDMTAHSAIASLIFQIIQQKPAVVSERNLDMRMFARANVSVTALWNLFVDLMKSHADGCLIYISIGSIGPDEFAVVEKFVRAVRAWDGPPVSVTIIHPFHEGFVADDAVIDIDGIYDVHPSLTTTDALQHVLMLELDLHDVPPTIRALLWDAVWRETRYAIIGVSFRQLTRAVQDVAAALARRRVEDGEMGEADEAAWLAGVGRWMDHKVASENVREQMQRHLDMIDLSLPEDARKSLGRHVKLLVFRIDADRVRALGTTTLTQRQRDGVWERMEVAMSEGPRAMFCGKVEETVADALDVFTEVPSRNPRQAATAVLKLLDERFGWEGSWKESILGDAELIVKSILEGIVMGFELVAEALLEDDEEGEEASG